MIFEPARKRAVNDDDRIVNNETKSGPANLQNKSILRIVAFMSAVRTFIKGHTI
jgi:hypothetical protein